MITPIQQVRRAVMASVLAVSLASTGLVSIAVSASAGEVPAGEVPAQKPVFSSGKVILGKSAKGRHIVAKRQGNPLAAKTLLVLGQMHGNEPMGVPVVKRLRQQKISGDVQVWTITTINPDGAKRGTRQNARGVDLNRNYPLRWRKSAKGIFYSGHKAASESETQAVMQFIDKLRPDGIVSFHQHANTVFTYCSKSRPWVLRIGELMKLPVNKKTNCKKERSFYRGTLNEWFTENHNAWFATVELPPSRVITKARLNRYTKSVVTIAGEIQDTNQAG